MNAKELLLNKKDLTTPLRAALAALLALITTFTALPPVAGLVLCLIGFLLAGYELPLAWWKDLRAKKPLTENLLMLLAALACFLAGRYPEAVLAAILFCAARFVAGRITARADRAFTEKGAAYDESKAAQIPDMAEGILPFYVPGVCLVAVLLAVIPQLFGAPASEWLSVSAAVLFALCPCAPLLAIHAAYHRAAGLSAEMGAIVCSEEATERLAGVNTVVFEQLPKDGSYLRVAELRPAEGLTAENLLMLASLPLSMEETEEAAAVLAAFGHEPDKASIAMGDTRPGLGTVVHTKGVYISAGNLRMMERLGLKEAAEANGGEDAIHVAVVNRYAGSILLERVTQSAANDPVHSVALLELNRLVLFADAGEDKPAHPGIDEVLTPFGAEEKALAMEKLLAETFSDETLLYYGPDPAMQKQADIGVAPLGAGRAGCAWLDTDKPEALAWLILQGKKAKSVSWEGLMLVLGLKLVLLIGTLAGILPLWTAVLADSGMALLAACNALRLK